MRPEDGASVRHRDLTGQTVLVTGATGGVGREVALSLGRLGADVFVHGRDRDRGEAVANQLRDLGVDSEFLRADFADLDAAADLAEAVRDRTDELDVLVNNAGAHFDDGWLTDAGVEATLHVNHLAPFALTTALRDHLTGGGRVVTVSSEVHRRADLDVDELDSLADYDGFAAYSRSKLANALFIRALARRLDGPDAVACHPGFVPDSGLWRNSSLPVRAVMRVFSLLPRPLTFGRVDSAASAAVTPTFLAAAETVESGAYYRDCRPVDPAEPARDDGLAADLWAWSEERVSQSLDRRVGQ
ncbi:SDR family NAD(P)-dependent oxidoreductase [Halobacterium jilantaiense]|uniref:Short chain dehydrogenase n=1 Tax=Halobacterium jilantaiense TaxID=355548 RepID=A0A1I0N813_9EURY|nr:SDR family NAD(P)-dependent oxidoreductase [Halobacterium jilantaiense]SEV97272.1 short chain dehydrogenase [Halobacterium jilantaiense]